MSPEKKLLLSLEATGKYVFHGSGSDIEELTPRQAYNAAVPDGEPSIFASLLVEHAIFMAIFNERNCGKDCWSHTREHNNILSYAVTRETIGQLRDTASGFVYVFNKEDFIKRDLGEIEYVSDVELKPIQKIIVSKQDLPENIEVVASPETPRV